MGAKATHRKTLIVRRLLTYPVHGANYPMKKNLVRLCLGIIVLALSIFITESRSAAHENNQNNKSVGVHEDIQGELEVIAECEKDKSRTLYNLKTGGKTLALHFAKEPKQNLLTGMKVRVHGVRSGDDVAADSVVTQDLGGSSTPTNLQAAATTLSNTTGDHKVAVIMVNFQDLQTQPYTTAQAQDVAFNTTSNYYRENSYGQTSLSGDVFGWFTIPVSSTSCDTSAIATYAQQAATNAGANLSTYNHYVYAFPKTTACVFSGRSTVGGSPSQSWINTNSIALPVLGHELGHSFGLFHSRSMDCGTAVIGGTCTTDEYGDSFDNMGATEGAHFNSFQKERLGWLNSGGAPPLQTITASGTYWIDAYETSGSSVKGLKILKSTDPTTGNKTWYYLEHRTASGFDNYLSYYGVQNGVVVRTGAEGNGTDTYLLDMTPATMNWYDSGLAAGQSFSDSDAGVTITTVSADNTGAWVQVSVNSQPCTHANPSVSVSPGQSQWLTSGTTSTYAVTVSNNESGGCSTGNFNLQASVPAGWTGTYSTPSLSVAPGGSSSTYLYVTSSAGTSDGTYNVGATAVNASNSAYTGSSSAAYVIVSTLGVAESSSSSTYTRSQNAKVTATVRAGGSPVVGTVVSFIMTKSNGSVMSSTGATDSNGNAIFQYALNRKKDPTGTYQVRAQASSNGLSGSGNVAFMVK
jgi:NPCBM-associated, NEW3 domain of alpha-galactosidase.